MHITLKEQKNEWSVVNEAYRIRILTCYSIFRDVGVMSARHITELLSCMSQPDSIVI